MKRRTLLRIGTAVVLTVAAVAAAGLIVEPLRARAHRTHLTAYFDNSNGIFPGDAVLILGVRVGEVDSIEPQPQRVRITFWVDGDHDVPADAHALIIAPQLVTSRSIQLTPAYQGGPTLDNGAVIPQQRTAVPVEWDDLRAQLQKLTESLQPDHTGGVSPLGAFVDTAADNLRGQGQQIRDTIVELSAAVSALGDHSDDIFGTAENLAVVVSALQSSTDLMRRLNQNLASVSGLIVDTPDEVGRALADIDAVANDIRDFVADNKEAIGTTSDKLNSVTTALVGVLDDIEQTLHVLPNVQANSNNLYYPAHAAQTGILAANNFSSPITFLCGAIQAASRLGAEQSAKLCAQYLAPIVKNRQYNFPPIGMNPIIGAIARPNEVTYSEDWMRPDYRPAPSVQTVPAADGGGAGPGSDAPLAAEAPHPPEPIATDPADGLPGMMVPAGSHS